MKVETGATCTPILKIQYKLTWLIISKQAILSSFHVTLNAYESISLKVEGEFNVFVELKDSAKVATYMLVEIMFV